jgi:hypothetical protein
MWFLVGSCLATTLTYKVGAHERACFFTQVQMEGEKVAFYFAVPFYNNRFKQEETLMLTMKY